MIEQQTGGFSLVNCYQANANCYISIGSSDDARNRGLSANVYVANTDGSRFCRARPAWPRVAPLPVNCAPPNTEANDVVVVAPRTRNATGDLTGTLPTPGTTPPVPADAARFYVFVTGPPEVSLRQACTRARSGGPCVAVSGKLGRHDPRRVSMESSTPAAVLRRGQPHSRHRRPARRRTGARLRRGRPVSRCSCRAALMACTGLSTRRTSQTTRLPRRWRWPSHCSRRRPVAR